MSIPRRSASSSVPLICLAACLGLAAAIVMLSSARSADEGAAPKVASAAAPASAAAQAGAVAPTGEYKVLKTFKTGLDGRFDFLSVDSESRRVFVSLGTRAVVFNADTGEKVGEVPDTPGIHGVAVAPEAGRGFTSNGSNKTVTVFDLKTYKALLTVPTSQDPDFIFYDAASQRVVACCNKGNALTVFPPTTQGDAKDIVTVELGGAPELAVSDGQGMIYVNLEDKSEVVRVDTKDWKVTARWPLAPGETPSGLAIDAKNGRLFSSCHNNMMVLLDAKTGKVLSTAPIGSGTDGALFDPKAGLAFSSNREGTITALRVEAPDKLVVAQTIQTAEGAKTSALDEKTGCIYLPTAKFGPPAPAPAQGEAKGEAKAEAKGEAKAEAKGETKAKDEAKGGAKGKGKGRPSIVPGSFMILVVGK